MHKSQDHHGMIVDLSGDHNWQVKKNSRDKFQRNGHLQVGANQVPRAPPGGHSGCIKMKFCFQSGYAWATFSSIHFWLIKWKIEVYLWGALLKHAILAFEVDFQGCVIKISKTPICTWAWRNSLQVPPTNQKVGLKWEPPQKRLTVWTSSKREVGSPFS